MNERLPAIAPTRIPFHPIVEQRYGIAAESWRALVDAVFPSARTIEGVMLALSYCKSRNLDVFKRPVHIVPIWNSALNKEVETVWPGIGELRTTAFRTGSYAGAEPAEFGPDLTQAFRGQVGRGDRQRSVEETVTFPEWCQITVYRLDRTGTVRKWPGPRVYWLETYQKQGRSEVPNEMWARRARGQLEKTAEAAALRRAFPEEIGEEYIGDEAPTMRDITPAAPDVPAAYPPAVDPMDQVVAEAAQQPRQEPAAARAAEPSTDERPAEAAARAGRQQGPTEDLVSKVEQWARNKVASLSDEELEAFIEMTDNELELKIAAHEKGMRRARLIPEPAAPTKRKLGRPTKAETEARQQQALARQIIAEINAAIPAEVDGVLQTREEDIAGLPDELRTQIAAAADDRMAAVSDDEPWDDPEPEPDPMGAENKPPVGQASDDDGFEGWRAEMESAVAGMPWDMRKMPARKNIWLAEAERAGWGERGAQAVEEAFAR